MSKGRKTSLKRSAEGWARIEFEDRYGAKCSLQDSSLATEPAIWLGVNDCEPKFMVPEKGWIDYPIHPDVFMATRMHLTQAMVKQLLPFLIRFAETGEYIGSDEEFKKLEKEDGTL